MREVYPQKIDNPVGIIGATRTEIGFFRKRLELIGKKRTGNGHFYWGRFAEKEVVVVKSGMGYAQARNACVYLIDRFAPLAICSFGLAGSVEKTITNGKILVATHFLRITDTKTPTVQETYTLDEHLTFITLKILDKNGIPYKRGKLLTVPHFIFKRADRDRIRRELEVDGVEMEGAAIAGEAKRRGVPVMALRVISDDLNSREIDYGMLMHVSGRISLTGVFRFALAHQRDLCEVLRFGNQAREFGRNLCEIQSRIVEGIAIPGDQDHEKRVRDD
jgi:adenosylhomocysteine nucleosidase